MDMMIKEKDMAKVRSAHETLAEIADRYEMSVEDLIEKCCGEKEESEEDEEYGEEPKEEGKPAVDKTKIAFIIGKMRGNRHGQE
jgi:hypothetical protein